MSGLVAALSLGAACGLWWAVPHRRMIGGAWLQAVGPSATAGAPQIPAAEGLLRRWAWVWASLAGAGTFALLGGLPGALVGVLAAVGVGVVIRRLEDPSVRRAREAASDQLPHLAGLLVSALEAGQPPERAIALVCEALPGPGADRLAPVVARLRLGVPPVEVWTALHDDQALAPLARTMSRVHRSGAPVAQAVRRLADDLRHHARTRVEDRARTVGVKAAVPLGLCLLPAFLLLGIVPMAVAAMESIAW